MPKPDDTPAVRRFRGRVRGLAREHRQRAAQHLGYMALLMSAPSFIGYLSLLLPGHREHVGEELVRMAMGTTIGLAVISLGVFFLTRSRISTQQKLNFGLVYQVLGSFLWALWGVYGLPEGPATNISGVPFIILWVTLYPIVAPAGFWRSFVANVLAAFAYFYAYFFLNLFDAVQADFSMIIESTGPVVTFALVTMVPVYFREKMGKDLEEVERMGSYELVRKLGEGGMGEVWKARHELLAHTTAIKLIKPERLLQRAGDSNADLAIRRFEREARATAALKCLNTVDLYDFGTTDSGTCYYVMELLDGMDLGTLVGRFGPLPAHRVVSLLRQICYSLIEAHERGMVHRDIKPANLFVCRLKPHYDVIKVLDFGLVKRTRMKTDETRLTNDGIVVGTPAYMAPELAVGEEDVDGRADLYSLGCVAYWLLTSEDVFQADTPMKVIMAHVSETPGRPSAHSELEITEPLEDIILACLEKHPKDRPQSARELEEQLANLELDEIWDNRSAEKWWTTHIPEDASEVITH